MVALAASMGDCSDLVRSHVSWLTSDAKHFGRACPFANHGTGMRGVLSVPRGAPRTTTRGPPLSNVKVGGVQQVARIDNAFPQVLGWPACVQ